MFVFRFFLWCWALATLRCTFCQPHHPKVLWTWQCWRFSTANRACQPDLLQEWSSRYSLVRILPTSSSKNAPNMTMFQYFDFEVQRGLTHNPVRFLSTAFPDLGPQPRKRRSYFGDPRSHTTRRKRNVLHTKRFHPILVALSGTKSWPGNSAIPWWPKNCQFGALQHGSEGTGYDWRVERHPKGMKMTVARRLSVRMLGRSSTELWTPERKSIPVWS